MREAILYVATVIVVLGLALILWREFADAADRRKVGPLRDTAEVLLPVIAMLALLWWVWVS
ncbi:MAG: hypothetical protein QNL12_14335 [Acidimicrobiia bacterium]|nr:hypothetical protein [Acidimicrobiia bacterium]MDX2468493.1 hypothetical protein [Acidimicrobiia bacterium]